MDNGRTVCPHHAGLCFPFCFPLSLSVSVSDALSVSPSSLSPCTEIPTGLRNRKLKKHELILNFASFFYLFFLNAFWCFLLCSAVSALFRFNLNTLGRNTFQLYMNQAAMNWIMLKHAAITELQYQCVWVCMWKCLN